MPKWYGIVFSEIWQINKNDICGGYSKMWKVFGKWEKLRNKIIQLYNYVKLIQLYNYVKIKLYNYAKTENQTQN